MSGLPEELIYILKTWEDLSRYKKCLAGSFCHTVTTRSWFTLPCLSTQSMLIPPIGALPLNITPVLGGYLGGFFLSRIVFVLQFYNWGQPRPENCFAGKQNSAHSSSSRQSVGAGSHRLASTQWSASAVPNHSRSGACTLPRKAKSHYIHDSVQSGRP